jgi:hypothetical protein
MSVVGIRDQAQFDEPFGSTDEKIALYRRSLSTSVLSQGLHALSRRPPFEGLSWDCFLADVELEARAARITLPRSWSAESISDTIKVLPPAAIVRLMAARTVYFSPLAPQNEAQVDWMLQRLDAATVKRMRQRRHAVHAAQAIEARREEARKEADAREEALRAQWYACPYARLSTEPEDFLRWIKVQTPDTWHVIVSGWDHNSDDRDDVIEWILDQPSCDLGTVAQFFFTTASGCVDQDPGQLSPCYRRKWLQTKRAADHWQRGHYSRNELDPCVEPSDMQYYDDLVARLEAEGRPLPWKVPQARRFGARRPDSAYRYEHWHLMLDFAVWKRHRERSGCGKDFPRCCQA